MFCSRQWDPAKTGSWPFPRMHWGLSDSCLMWFSPTFTCSYFLVPPLQ